MPTKAQQVRQEPTQISITAANVAAQPTPLPPCPGNNGPAGINNNAAILDALRLALAEARETALSFDEANQFQPVRTVFGSQTRAEVMTALVAHSYDHYGQMVVYARLLGVTPPASTKVG